MRLLLTKVYHGVKAQHPMTMLEPDTIKGIWQTMHINPGTNK
jgi:hypothetical protein